MYAVAGVTGHTGAIVANTLLAQGQKVRVLVRSMEKGEPWKKKGAEVFVADLGDDKALTAAFEGVKGVYLLNPPNWATKDFLKDSQVVLEQVVAALKNAKVPNVVYLSSVAAQQPSGTGPVVTVHRAEQALKGIAPSVTFVRASYFLENWGSMVGLAKAQGILPYYGAVDVKFPQISTLDIGKVAAEALLKPADGTRVIELTGKEDWSVQDVAAALGTILGKQVTAVAAPVDQALPGLIQAGVPEPMAKLYAEMYQAFATGHARWEFPNKVTRGSTPLVDALKTFVSP